MIAQMNDPRAINPAESSIASESTQSFVDAMAMAATGVTVVVTDGAAGKAGITVSAFTSVSADPPLVLICVNRKSAAVETITANAKFCVNLLGEDHRELANVFAGRDADAKAAALEAQYWVPGLTGLPRLPDAPAAFECTLHETLDAGTHRIFIGRVVKAHHSQTPALAYSRRTYSHLAPL
jgi:flavin reductase (DIM6/NTAB) family NADH-FMN oxidoreductase RutF